MAPDDTWTACKVLRHLNNAGAWGFSAELPHLLPAPLATQAARHEREMGARKKSYAPMDAACAHLRGECFSHCSG